MATTIYLFRHQAAGIITTHAFARKPTSEQVAPLVAECERLHGTGGWGMVHELLLLDGSEVPDVPQAASSQRSGTMAPVSVSGRGTVT